jgi:hypothetical protein
MATVTNNRKVLSVEGKDEVIRKIENGKKKERKKESRRVLGSWSCNFYAPNNVQKHAEIFQCV